MIEQLHCGTWTKNKKQSCDSFAHESYSMRGQFLSKKSLFSVPTLPNPMTPLSLLNGVAPRSLPRPGPTVPQRILAHQNPSSSQHSLMQQSVYANTNTAAFQAFLPTNVTATKPQSHLGFGAVANGEGTPKGPPAHTYPISRFFGFYSQNLSRVHYYTRKCSREYLMLSKGFF